MAIPKESRARSTAQQTSVGLMAIGSSGPWEVAIDQTVSGPDRWSAKIEGPSVYLSFEIPSLKIIDRAIEFLTRFPPQTGRNDAHSKREEIVALGSSKSARVNLVRDDEFSDRYFLIIEPKGELLIRFTIAGDDLTHLIDALRQAKADLE